MLVAGSTAAPTVQVENLGEVLWSSRLSSSEARSYHELAIALKGFGAGLLTLGLLGLFVPWINALLHGWRRSAIAASPPAELT
jgi:hypothetical protein